MSKLVSFVLFWEFRRDKNLHILAIKSLKCLDANLNDKQHLNERIKGIYVYLMVCLKKGSISKIE